MRVISGKYKGRRFEVPRTFKARPTTDFAKENLFNVLGNRLDYEESLSALDLFAGTGSISLELLSRGCARVVSVEKEPLHYAFISKIKKDLGIAEWFPCRGDVFKYVAHCHVQFDFVFADPPYDLPELPELPDLVLRHAVLKPGGLLVLEHGKRNNFELHPCFVERRVYGSVNFSFFLWSEEGRQEPHD